MEPITVLVTEADLVEARRKVGPGEVNTRECLLSTAGRRAIPDLISCGVTEATAGSPDSASSKRHFEMTSPGGRLAQLHFDNGRDDKVRELLPFPLTLSPL